MSKFAKMCCILGGIIFAIGIILCIVGLTMGFSFSRASELPYISNFLSRHGSTEGETVVYEEVIEADEVYKFSKAEIKKLDINIKYGMLTIETHSEDYIAVTTTQADSDFKCKKSGNTLKIEDKRREYLGGILYNEYEGSYVHVFVPEDMFFEEIDIEVGAGDANVETLNCADISIEVGAGTFTGQNIISNKKAKFEVGAGRMDIMELKSKETKLENGVGETIISGTIAGDMTINCGVGSVQLDILGAESDYNYDIDRGIGTIRIGEIEFSGLTGRKRIDNNSDTDVKIDCGIGSVQLDFFE